MRRRFRALREAKDLTQGQLAVLVGVKHATINKIEAGTRKPSVDVALRLQSILDSSIDDLLVKDSDKLA